MTNNPTIDGVSRELRKLLERIVQGGDILDSSEAMYELRALLDTPAVEPASDLREHCKQCAEVVKTWPEWKRGCLGGEPVVERQPFGFWRVPKGYPLQGMFVKWTEESAHHIESAAETFDFIKLYNVTPEVAALQSTIARYLDRITELESWRVGANQPNGTTWPVTMSGLCRDTHGYSDVRSQDASKADCARA